MRVGVLLVVSATGLLGACSSTSGASGQGTAGQSGTGGSSAAAGEAAGGGSAAGASSAGASGGGAPGGGTSSGGASGAGATAGGAGASGSGGSSTGGSSMGGSGGSAAGASGSAGAEASPYAHTCTNEGDSCGQGLSCKKFSFGSGAINALACSMLCPGGISGCVALPAGASNTVSCDAFSTGSSYCTIHCKNDGSPHDCPSGMSCAGDGGPAYCVWL